jgi:oxygen-independent coproporphyrinogen-3 oxidase
MNPSYIAEIIEDLKLKFAVSDDAEVTLETNPGTVDKIKLKDFRNAGINRLSVGIQSFHNDELRFLTRIHDSKTAIETIINANNSGFNNISLDLIFNLPGQTKQKWSENLLKAVSLPITHISTYSLILERGTILNKMVLDKKVVLQDDDYDADLYEYTIDFLEERDLNQYEVSNFCFHGYQCRHNNAYWRYRDYLSFGTSAHSFMGGKRWWNFSSLKRYINEINTSGNAVAGSEIVNEKQQLDEYVMLALRSSGIDLPDFNERFGNENQPVMGVDQSIRLVNWIKDKNDYFVQLKNRNLLTIDESSIRLTKEGYAVCDEILANLL